MEGLDCRDAFIALPHLGLLAVFPGPRLRRFTECTWKGPHFHTRHLRSYLPSSLSLGTREQAPITGHVAQTPLLPVGRGTNSPQPGLLSRSLGPGWGNHKQTIRSSVFGIRLAHCYPVGCELLGISGFPFGSPHTRVTPFQTAVWLALDGAVTVPGVSLWPCGSLHPDLWCVCACVPGRSGYE